MQTLPFIFIGGLKEDLFFFLKKMRRESLVKTYIFVKFDFQKRTLKPLATTFSQTGDLSHSHLEIKFEKHVSILSFSYKV